MIKTVRLGLFTFTFGARSSRVQWVHVDNLVAGLTLAAQGLSAGRQHVAAGQAYFIADPQPINNFEFLR